MRNSRNLVAVAAFVASLVQQAPAAYTWPDEKIDVLEALLYERQGRIRGGMFEGVRSCDSVAGPAPGHHTTAARTNAAEWLRTAYHDVADADVGAGTGGLDASIAFDLEHGDNVGAAFNSSMATFVLEQSVRSSLADIIALGTVIAVETCSNGSIVIPYRAGRVDATQPNPDSSVPRPGQNLATHTAMFKRQGFSTADMVGLVACGHTIGGVHGGDFPTIVSLPSGTVSEERLR